MKEQEILEYNKRCAELLGWKETTEQFKIDWIGCKTKERLDRLNKLYIPILEKEGDVLFSDFSVMDFTKDWNWIMEVVEAIKKLPFNFYINPCGCSIKIWEDSLTKEWINAKFKDIHVWGGIGFKTNLKEAVVKAINQFLIWHKDNSNDISRG
jgi:hypothetical protein